MRNADEMTSSSLTPMLESWRKIFKNQEAKRIVEATTKVRGCASTDLSQPEIQGILKEHSKTIDNNVIAAVSSLQAEIEAACRIERQQTARQQQEFTVLQTIINTCEDRIAYAESFIEFTETATVEEFQLECKTRFGIDTTKASQKNANIIFEASLRREFIEGARRDIEFYKDVKKLIFVEISSPCLLEMVYNQIHEKWENEKTATKKANRTNSECEIVHLAKMLRLLKPLLSPAYDACEKNMEGVLNSWESHAANLRYAESLRDDMQSFKEKCGSSEYVYILQEVQALESTLLNTIELVRPHTLDPRKEKSSNAISSSITSASTSAVASQVQTPKTRQDYQAKNLERANIPAANLEDEDQRNHVVALRETFFALYEIRQSFSELQKVMEGQLEWQRFEALLRVQHEKRKNNAVKPQDKVKREPKDDLGDKTETAPVNILSVPATLPAATPAVLVPAVDDAETEEDRRIREDRRQREEKLYEYKQSIALKREAKANEIKQRAEQLRADNPSTAEADEKEDAEAELQLFEAEQLVYLLECMKPDHHRTMQSLSNKSDDTLYDPNLLVFLKVINGSAALLGSSHFEILVPDTHKLWPRNARTGDYDFENVPMRRRVSWVHNNAGGHSKQILKPRAKSRCLAAMTSAGITPERFEAAKAKLRTERRLGRH